MQGQMLQVNDQVKGDKTADKRHNRTDSKAVKQADILCACPGGAADSNRREQQPHDSGIDQHHCQVAKPSVHIMHRSRAGGTQPFPAEQQAKQANIEGMAGGFATGVSLARSQWEAEALVPEFTLHQILENPQ